MTHTSGYPSYAQVWVSFIINRKSYSCKCQFAISLHYISRREVKGANALLTNILERNLCYRKIINKYRIIFVEAVWKSSSLQGWLDQSSLEQLLMDKIYVQASITFLPIQFKTLLLQDLHFTTLTSTSCNLVLKIYRFYILFLGSVHCLHLFTLFLNTTSVL